MLWLLLEDLGTEESDEEVDETTLMAVRDSGHEKEEECEKL